MDNDMDYDIMVINEILNSPTSTLQLIVDYYGATKNDNFVFNILTTFINNEIVENGIELFILQYFDSIASDDFNNINNMISNWIVYLETIYSDNEIHELFIKLQRTIIEKSSTIENKDFSKIMTKKMWSFSAFRKSIKCYKKYNTGIEYTFNGIFLSLFQKMTWTEPATLLSSLDTLIQDESIHEYLVDYIYDILQVNLPYTYDNFALVDQKKCSSMHFNTFLLKIIVKIIKHYSLQTINDSILSGDIYVAKNYEINNLPFYHKLMVVALYAISIFHTPIIKTYFRINEQLNYINDIYATQNEKNIRTSLKLKESRLMELIADNDKTFLQHLYANYLLLFKKIKIEEIYLDVMTYIDYATSFENKNNPYGIINKELYKYISSTMGGFLGHANNVHIRHYSSELMQKILPTEGFDVFGGTGEVFNNLFRFISEVDFFKWTSLEKAIVHQKKILEMMMMLLDFPVTISQNRRSIISGTIFNVLKRGIYLFDSFTVFCTSIQDNIYSINKLKTTLTDMIDCIILTLTFHRTIYNKQIVATIYPEVEEKYIIFIDKLLQEIMSIAHPIYTVIRRPDMAAQIVHLSYASIYEHVKLAPSFINKIKDTLIIYSNSSGLIEVDKQILIKHLESFVNDNIEYPPELLDPLSCNIIMDPVKIPNIEDIFDRSTILTHIFESYPTPTNPYTREPLSIEMFDEYNEKQEVKDEINLFLKKKEDFLRLNTK